MRYATKPQVVIRRVNILQSCRMLSFALEKGKRSDSGGTRDRITHSKVDCQKGATSAIDKLRWLRYVSCYMQQKYQEGPKPKTFGAVRPPSLPPPIPQKQPHHFLPHIHIHLHLHNPRLQPSPHRAPYIGTPPQTCNKTLIHDGPPPRKKKELSSIA